MNTPQHPKRFSMIREFHLADWFTLGNAVCGVGALFSASRARGSSPTCRHLVISTGRQKYRCLLMPFSASRR